MARDVKFQPLRNVVADIVGKQGDTGISVGATVPLTPVAAQSRPSLVSKLAEVMAAVERIPKRGYNDFHKYDYATEADIAAAIRKELAARQVMLIPSIVAEERHQVGEKGDVLTVLSMQFEFLDGETGQSLIKPWRGYGSDKSDKGGYKAMTGGEKYFLLKTFLMPTGDDPERDQPKEREKATARPAPKPPVVVPSKKTRPPLPDDTVYIESVEPQTKGDKTWHRVTFSTGEYANTTNKELVAFCEMAARAEFPVRIGVHLSPKGGTVLDSVERWKPEPPADLDSIPF